jgi:hypothetical protein
MWTYNDYTTTSDIIALNEFKVPCNHPVTIDDVSITHIKIDDGDPMHGNSIQRIVYTYKHNTLRSSRITPRSEPYL